MKEKMKKSYQSNKLFFLIITIELLFLCTLFIKVWSKPIEIHYSPSDFSMVPNLGVQLFEDGNVGTVIADENEHDGYDILTLPIAGIKSGAYEITVNYESSKSMANPRRSVNDVTGTVSFSSDKNRMALQSSVINLDDGHNTATGRLWMRISSHISDLTGTVHFNGNGKLAISSITIVEKPIWRIMRMIGYLISFLLLDGFYVLFFSEGMIALDKNKRFKIASLLGIILFSSLPLFANFIFKLEGHDLKFHLERLWGLADALNNGQFPVRMHTGMLNDAGYATPLFYGEIFLYFPALLYNLMVPLQTCYMIYGLIVNIATCLISYFCFKEISSDYKMGILASFLYTLAAYRLTNFYLRASVGEYTGMIFLPLLILGFWRIYAAEHNRKFKLREYLPIILGLTGVIQSHIITCEMIAIFIICVCVAFIKKTVTKNRFFALLKALILTILVNIWFLVPFMESLQMKIYVARTDVVNQIQHFGAYFIQIFAIFQPGYGSCVTGMGHEMPMSMGLPFIVALCLFLYCCLNRKEWNLKENKTYQLSLVAFVAITLGIGMTTIYCPWDTIKYANALVAYFLCDLQFPWRYLTMVSIFAVLLSVSVVQLLEQKKGKKFAQVVIYTLVASGILVTGVFYWQFTFEAEMEKAYTIEDVGNMEVMGAEYLLIGSQTESVTVREAIPSSNQIEILEWNTEKGVTSIDCHNNSDVEGTIEIPIFNYDNYHAIAEATREELTIQNSSNNTIKVVVPGNYSGIIKVYYREPIHWRVCEVLSLIAIITIVYIVVREKKDKSKEKRAEA